jgi:hypothetical protein
VDFLRKATVEFLEAKICFRFTQVPSVVEKPL